MRTLGFRAARSKTIAALLAGPAYILFEDRTARESKNLLDTGEVSPEEVVAMLRACRGSRDQYREAGHDRDPSVPVHTFKPMYEGSRWYVKVYFLDGTAELEPAVFISVHRSNG